MPDGRVSRWRTVRRWEEELRQRLGFSPAPPPPSIPPQPARFPTAPVTPESYAAREMGPRLRELQTQLHPRPSAPPPPSPGGIESAGQAAWQLAQIPLGFTEQALANLREIITKARREEFPQRPQMPPTGSLARRIGRGAGQFVAPIFPEESRGSALEAAMMFPPFAAGREIGPVLPAIQKAMGAVRAGRAAAGARVAESLVVPGRAEAGFAGIPGKAGLPREPLENVGRRAVAYGPDPSKPYEIQYRIVELDDLIPSHTDAFAPNPAYPKDLQPRMRERGVSRLWVRETAGKLAPEALVTDVATLDRGLPIIGADMVVESGNGRVMAMRLARQDFPERWEAYQKALRESLPQFGIQEERLVGMRNPVVVRERLTPVDRVRFAQEANQPVVMGMSPVENALQDAGKIRLENIYIPEETLSFETTLRLASNKPFVMDFLQVLPPNERGMLLDIAGDLNLAGVQRLKAAMFARTYPGMAGQRLTQIFFESREPIIRNVEEGMMASLSKMARAEDLIRSGARQADLSIAEDLAAGLDMLARLKQQKLTVPQYLTQIQMFERPLSPFQEQLLRYFDGIARSPKAVRRFLGDYADRVIASPHPEQVIMPGVERPTKEGLLNAIIRQEQEGPLFAAFEKGAPPEAPGITQRVRVEEGIGISEAITPPRVTPPEAVTPKPVPPVTAGGFVAPTAKGSVEQGLAVGIRQAKRTGQDVYVFPTGEGMKLGKQPPPFGLQHYIVKPDGSYKYVEQVLPKAEAVRPAVPEAAEVKGIPAMITRDMEARLRAMGITETELRQMTPQQAWERLGGMPEAVPTIPPSLAEGPPLGVKVAEPAVPPTAEELTIFPKAAEITSPPPGGPPLLERTPHDEVLAQIKAQREAIAARRKAGEKISVRMGKRAKGPIPLGPEEIPPVPSERALALRPPVELPPPDVPPSAFAKEVVTEKGGLPAFTLFNQPTEELLRIAKSEGIPVDMLKYAQGEARTVAPELNAFSRLVHPLRVVLDPIKSLHPDVQDAYLLRSRIGQADRLQVQAGATGISRMLSELLGETTAKAALEGKRIPELASLFKGKIVPSQEPYIGTVRHVLDFSERYELPHVWRRFVSEWNGIHDSNLAILVNKLGVKTGEVKDIYVTQSIVAQKAGRGVPGRPLGKPGVFRPRKMDADQFYAWAAGQDYQVKTDLLDLFLSRMTSAGNLKADITFLDALALKSGGKRLGMGLKPGVGEGVIQQRGISWLLPEDIAADAKTALAPAIGGEEAAVNAIVDNLRAVLLQFDFSLMGMRQGLLAFTANPVGTLQGYGRIWQMLRSPEAQAAWLAQNVERMMFYSQRGAKLQVSPLELPTHVLGGPTPLIERVPGVAWLNHVQFNLGMPVLKLSLMEKNLATLRAIQGSEGLAGLTHKVPGLGKVVKGLGGKLYKMSDDDLVKVAIDAASNHIGGVESARYVAGRTSALRNLLILTENWTRAQIGIVVNLPKFSPQGILARRMLMQEMLFAVGLAAVVGTITGKGFTLDPRSRLFGKVWIPGVGYVSFLPHAALIRTVARGIAGLPEGEFGAEKPWWLQRAETLWRWSDGRAGQFPHLVTDLAHGVDYAGRQIENKALYALKELAPIPGQNLKEAWTRGTDLKGLGVTAIFAVAGADVTPQSSRDALAELAGVSSMDELEPKQRIQLEMTPGARAVRKKAGATQAQRRRELAYDYFDSQLARDMLRAQGKMSKDQWRDSYYREKAKFAAQRDAWDKAFGIKYPDSKKPEEQALSGYYELFELYTDPVTKLFDGEGFELAEAEYLMALSVPLRDYLERNLGSYATPTAERFQTAKRQFLQDYWNLDKAFLEDLPETQRETWFDYIQLKRQNPDKAAIQRKATQLIRTLETKFNKYKLGWRIKNQKADDALVEWYGYVPASEQLPKPGRRPPPKWPTPKGPTGARRG